MSQKNLLDAYGLLYFLQKEGPFQVVKELFRKAQLEENPVIINEMSVGEAFYVTARNHSLEKAEAFLPLLEVLPVEVISNTREDILFAARLKAEYALGYTSALIAATAKAEGATLVTGDSEFRKVEGMLPIHWLV